MFEGFTDEFVETGEARIHVRRGGTGPPLLLLHGHPQTHVMWHLVAPCLADVFTVVVADLRGYGDSSKPPTTSDHEPYSKRAMARDMVAAMGHLGFDRFGVVGHDRGGRVAYRLALDHPAVVTRLAVLDIIPTAEAWRRADYEFGMSHFHWFFLAQPAPMVERLVDADPNAFYFRRGTEHFAPEALSAYERAIRDQATRHAMIEDYRAGATIDRELDEADLAAARKISCPVLVLWSGRDDLARRDVLGIWRGWAADVRGRAIDAGHYLAEEASSETCAELKGFFAQRAAPTEAR